MKKDTYLRANNCNEIERQRRTFHRVSRTHEAFFALLEENLKPRRNLRVLEVACGCGLMANEARERWACRVEGWDITDEYLAAARKFFPSITFTKCGFMHPRPPAVKYDLVIFREALMETAAPHALLRWSAGLVKRGGWVAALEPDYGATLMYPAVPGWEEFLEKYRSVCGSKDENFFFGRALPQNFHRAGFRNIKFRPILETNSFLDKAKFAEFMAVEAFSIEEDMANFGKQLKLPAKKISAVIGALHRLPEQKGAYLQTMMMGVCGQV